VKELEGTKGMGMYHLTWLPFLVLVSPPLGCAPSVSLLFYKLNFEGKKQIFEKNVLLGHCSIETLSPPFISSSKYPLSMTCLFAAIGHP